MKPHGPAAVVLSVLMTTTGAEPPVATSDHAAAARELIARMSGEWEGQVQARNGSSVSGSVFSLSGRTEHNGLQVSSCFQGFAFGYNFEGASTFSYNPVSNRFESVWTNGSVATTFTTSAGAGTNTSSLTFVGWPADRTGGIVSIEQTFTFTDQNSYTTEIFTVTSSGQKTSVFKVDMTRMAAGTTTAAAAQFETSSHLARLRGTSQQAVVNTEK